MSAGLSLGLVAGFLLLCAALLLGFCSSWLAFFLFSFFLCFVAVFLPFALSSLEYHHHIDLILFLMMLVFKINFRFLKSIPTLNKPSKTYTMCYPMTP